MPEREIIRPFSSWPLWLLVSLAISVAILLAVLTIYVLAATSLHRGERDWDQTVSAYAERDVVLDAQKTCVETSRSEEPIHPDWLIIRNDLRQQSRSVSIPDWFAARQHKRHGAWSPLSTETLAWLATNRSTIEAACRYLDAHPNTRLTAMAVNRVERHGQALDVASWFSRSADSGNLAAGLMLTALCHDDASSAISYVDRYLAAISAGTDDLLGFVQDAKQRKDALQGLLAMAILGRVSPGQGDFWCAKWRRPLQEPLANAIRMTMCVDLPLVAQAYSDRATLRASWWQAIGHHDLEEILRTWAMTTQTHAQAVQAIPYLQELAAWCQDGNARTPIPQEPESFRTLTMVGEVAGKLGETCQQLVLLGTKHDLLSAAVRLVSRVRAGVPLPQDVESCRTLLPDLPWQHAATGLALTYDLSPPACFRLRWVAVPGVTPNWAKADLHDQAPCPSGDATMPYRITKSSICLDLVAEPRVRLRDPILDPGRGAKKATSSP